jgi:hypothetical protein
VSWMEAVSDAARSGKVRAHVVLNISEGKRGRQRRLTISVRTQLIGGMEWCEPGKTVKLLVGAAEHAGKLRIQAGGSVPVSKPYGPAARDARSMASVIVSDAAVPLLKPPPGKLGPVGVEYTQGVNWLEITLPTWTEAKVPESAAASARSEPFRGIASRMGVEGSRAAGGPIR